jgi:hypothetical protein
MGDLLGSLIWGAKSGQYCVIGGRSLQLLLLFSFSPLFSRIERLKLENRFYLRMSLILFDSLI